MDILSTISPTQSNGKLEVFHKYLKPTLKKLCERDPYNWDQYLNQVLASYRVTPNIATAEMPFFWYIEGIQTYPCISCWNLCSDSWDPNSGMLNLEAHRLTLAIAKKTLDDNHLKAALNPWIEHHPPST